MGCIHSKPNNSIHDEATAISPTYKSTRTTARITPTDLNYLTQQSHTLQQQSSPTTPKQTTHSTPKSHTTPNASLDAPLTNSQRPRKSILRNNTESTVGPIAHHQHSRHPSNKSISKIHNDSTLQQTNTLFAVRTDASVVPPMRTDSLALPQGSITVNNEPTTVIRSFRNRRKGRAKSVDATQFYQQQQAAQQNNPKHSTNISFDQSNTLPMGVSSHRVPRQRNNTSLHATPKQRDSNAPSRMGSKPPSRRNSKLVRRTSFQGLMNQLALKFPLIRRSFSCVHAVFKQYHLERQAIELENATQSQRNKVVQPDKDTSLQQIFNGEAIRHDQLQRVLQDITQYKYNWSAFEVLELFKLADLDHSKTISFREFLIVIAVGYFLKVESTDPEFIKIQAGFKVIQNAFDTMDSDQSGTIDLDELKTALFDITDTYPMENKENDSNDHSMRRYSTMSATNRSVLEQRFRELDFNGDKSIEFPEFLFCIYSWVGFEDDTALLDDVDTETVNGTESSRERGQLSKRSSHSHKL